MRRLLKYAVMLAVAVALGAYVILGPVGFDDIFPSRPGRVALPSQLEPTQPATIDEELDYMVAKRLASLEGWRAFLAAHANGAYAQSARAEIERRLGSEDASADAPAAAPASTSANQDWGYSIAERLRSLASYGQAATGKVEQLLLATTAPAPEAGEVSSGSSTGATAASAPPESVSPPSRDATPAAPPLAVTNDAPGDAKPVAEAARPAAAPVGTDVAPGVELAALPPDAVCRRDEDRLQRLRSNPSRNEAQQLADDLACEKLRPEVLSLIESLATPPAAGEVSNVAPSDAQTGNEAARAVSPVAGMEVAEPTSDESCKGDADRLDELRLSPSREEARRFASELKCEQLRPQLQRLVESLDSMAPAPPPANSPPAANKLFSQVCVSERAALDRLRKEPSAEAAGRFWRDLNCEGLRPQVRLLLESLNVTPEPLGSTAAPGKTGSHEEAASDASTPNGTDPVACRRETAELNRIRAAPDLGEARRFASSVICEALKPQASRLLESLSE